MALAFIATALPDGGTGVEFRAIASIVLWAAVISGLAFGFWPRSTVPRPALTAGAALAGLAAFSALSMAWGNDDGRSFEEAIRGASYLGAFACVVLASEAGSARLWLNGLMIGIVLVGLFALAARLLPNQLPGSDLVEVVPDTAQRLSYPLDYWNAMGLLFTTGILLLGWVAMAGTARHVRAAAVGGIAALGLALFLTSSRGAVAALAVGLIVLVALQRDRRRLGAALVVGGAGAAALSIVAVASPALLDGLTEDPAITGQGVRLVLGTIVVAAGCAAIWATLERHSGARSIVTWLGTALVALIVLGAILATNPIDRIGGLCDRPAASTPTKDFVTQHFVGVGSGGRCQFWNSALDAFGSSPAVGIGAGGYQSWWGEHGTIVQFVVDAHSLFLEQLAELGPLGLAMIVLFFAAPLAAGLRRRHDEIPDPAVAPAVAVLVAVGTLAAVDWMWETPAAFVPAVVCAALLAGPALCRSTSRDRNRFEFGIATLAIGWIVILAASASLFTDLKLGASRDAVDDDRLEDAASLAREARTLQPWASEPRLQEAQVEALLGDTPAARAALDAAIERAPTDWRIWYFDSQLRAREGDIRGSLESTNRTNRLKPDVRVVERTGT